MDVVIAGQIDTGFAKVVDDYLENNRPGKRYDRMIRTFRETGKVEEEDRDLLIEFLKKELFPSMYKERITEKLTGEATRKLSTAYLRSEMDNTAEKAVDTAFSMLPGYVVLGVIAVLVLLYFVADRHVPGDAFIGIGALLITVCGDLALSGVLHAEQSIFWKSLAAENYFAYALSGAFLGFHQAGNLIAAAVGLALVIIGIFINVMRRRRDREPELG